jgi:CheY-like chemotaxis protein
MHQLYRLLFQPLGVDRLIEASDIEEGLKLTERFKPDLAFIDYHLGAESGLQFVQQIRQRKNSPAPYLPLILCTGFARHSVITAARNAGANECLVKPLSPTQLQIRMREVTENPRPFIDVDVYFGPCRRRKFIDELAAMARRCDDDPSAPDTLEGLRLLG